MNEGYDFSGLLDAADDMMQGQMPDPFQDPPAAEPQMSGRAFGDMPEDAPVPVQSAPPPVDVMPMDSGRAFGADSNYFAIPEMRRQEDGYEDPGSKLMRAALGQAGEKMGGTYFTSGGTDWGQPVEDDRGYRQGPLGGMAQLNPDRVVDYSSTGIDTSGNNPVLRVMNMNGDQMVGKPIKDFNDLGSIPSPSAPIRDANGDYVLDDRGNRTYSPLPGFDYRRVAGAGLYPDRLENGQTVMGDRFNPGVTWSVGADGLPSRALVGGTGMENFDRQRAMAYGLVPTNSMRDGRPVYSEIVGQNPDGSPVYGRSWERNRDGSAGRQILDVNRDPRYLDGGRAGGGQGGSGGGGFIRRDPPPPPTEREVPIYNFANGQSIDLGETGAFRTTENGQRVQLTEAEVAKRIAAQRAADQAALEAAGQAPMVDGPRSIGSTVYQGQQVQVQEQGGRYYLSGGGSRVEVPATLIQQLRAEGKMK